MAGDGDPEKSYRESFLEALGKGIEQDPFPEAASFQEMAIGQNEMYQAWKKAGFEEKQALFLLAVSMSGSPGPAPPA